MSVMPDPSSELSAGELQRYARHLALPELGIEGQQRLRAARVLLLGAGGLGSPAALWLAAAGVGTLGIVDDDVVDLSNLQRQVLHGTASVGARKVDSAAARVRELNPHVRVEPVAERLTSANAMRLVRGWDVVVDGTDNFATRYAATDAAFLSGIPYVYGSVHRFEGQVAVLGTGDAPCYRCLHPAPPPAGTAPSCAEAGVLGVVPGLVGMLQATEALKLVAGIGAPLAGRLLLVDALAMRFTEIRVPRRPDCPLCGTRTITAPLAAAGGCAMPDDSLPDDSLPGDAVPRETMPDDSLPRDWRPLDPAALAARLREGTAPELLDVREPWEWNVARLPGARLVPLGALEQALPTLDLAKEWVIYCHHGVRSAMAADLLVDAGARRVWNLEGGIERWSREVDPGVARY